MKIAQFNPPGNIDDFASDPSLPQKWTAWMSKEFDTGVASVSSFLNKNGGGTCQFYNPLTNGSSAPDLSLDLTNIPWNGFPKRFSATGPGHPTNYAGAEPPGQTGAERPQDEYLEWFTNRTNGKVTSVHFTCEAFDYFQFLAANAPARVLQLYRTYINNAVQMADLLQNDGTYDPLNKWTTEFGAMHLTNSANNLFAEVFLAASATVRRTKNGAELTASIPLIQCALYGEADRNSDPNIGAAVNGLARDGRSITLADPVGLYMGAFDGSGITLNGNAAGGFFKVVRGTFPKALRAVFELPANLAAQGLTVSDVEIGGTKITYGGQLAERITMHLVGAASVDTSIQNAPTGCGAIPQVDPTNNVLVAQAKVARIPFVA